MHHATLPRRASVNLVGAALLSLLCAPTSALAQSSDGDRAPPGRTVYVPIEDFDEVFDREKGGVFVPYRELLDLLDRAEADPPAPEPEPAAEPPADFVLVGAQLQGTAGERVVRFEATFDLEVLSDEWVIVPIALGEAALEEVTTSSGARAVVGQMSVLKRELAARIARDGGDARARARAQELPSSGYGVILEGAGRLQTTARFAVPIASKPGQSSFGLSLPQAALTNFEVTLPQSGLRVDVQNALATEETSVEDADQTRVRAYFGAAAQARVTWNPRPKQVEGEARDPLLFAETETSLKVDEGVLQTTTRIDYRILQAPCGEFRIRFPAGYTLLSASGQNMSADPVPEADGEGGQTITVRLHEPAEDAYSLSLRLEKILGEGAQEIAFPRVATLGTERESGLLAARASRYLTLEPTTLRGLSQIDASGISQPLARDLGYDGSGNRPPLVFRYLRQPYSLNLQTAPIEPEVDGKVMTLALVRDDEIAVSTTIQYHVRKRGIFGVRVQLPPGFKPDDVPDDRNVKDWRVEDGVLAIDFVSQREGQFNVPIVGIVRRDPNDPETDSLRYPLFRLLDVRKETGVIAIGAQSHLKLSLEEDSGLVPVAADDLRGLGFPHAAAAPNEEVVFGYRYGKPDGVSAEYSVTLREPKVSVEVEALVDAQEDLVRVESAFKYDVEFAGVEEVRVRVPQALADEEDLKIEGDGVQDRRVVPDPDREGHAIWTIALQGKRIGDFTVRFRYDIKLDDFAPGQQKNVSLHEIEALDCFSETGDIALKKHENLVIEDALDMIERRDKRELPEALRRQGPIHAYRYVSHPHDLTLEIVKYDFQAPLGLIVNHLHLDQVVTQDGEVQVEAWLALQNNAEQSLAVLLPEGAEFYALKVDGETKSPSTGSVDGREAIIVHLGEVTKERRQEPFQLRLRYDLAPQGELSGMGELALTTLRFPVGEDGAEDVPVARVTRSLYLPEDVAYLEFDTDATKHFEEHGLWEDMKAFLHVPTGREHSRPRQGARQCSQDVAALKGMAPDADDGRGYPRLVLPGGVTPKLFEKLDNPTHLNVSYSSWSLFYILDVLVLIAVVAGGVLLDSRKLLSPLVYVPAVGGLMLLGAIFGGTAYDPFFASGFVGSLGLGAFFLGRAAWRELTVNRHARRLEELNEEAQVARARAQAAEAEARLRGEAPAPVGAAAGADPKARELSGAERTQAESIGLDRPSGPAEGGGTDAPPSEGGGAAGDAPAAGGGEEGSGDRS